MQAVSMTWLMGLQMQNLDQRHLQSATITAGLEDPALPGRGGGGGGGRRGFIESRQSMSKKVKLAESPQEEGTADHLTSRFASTLHINAPAV